MLSRFYTSWLPGTGANYAVEVRDEKLHDLRLMSHISLTVVGVVNKNSGVPAFRAVIAPRPEARGGRLLP